jgi:hypothetical protein
MRSKNVLKEDIEAGIALLEQQIEDARHLLKQRPLNNKMHLERGNPKLFDKDLRPEFAKRSQPRVDRRRHSRVDGNAAGGSRNIPGIPPGEVDVDVEKLHRLLETKGRQFGARIDMAFKGPSKK